MMTAHVERLLGDPAVLNPEQLLDVLATGERLEVHARAERVAGGGEEEGPHCGIGPPAPERIVAEPKGPLH